MNIVRRVLNLSDIVPLNREWKAVKANVSGSCHWTENNRIRRDLIRHIQKALLIPGHTSILLGAAGSGRETLLRQALDEHRHVPIMIRCENASHHSFTAFLAEVQECVASGMARGFRSIPQPQDVVFRSLCAECPDFPSALCAMHEAIQRGHYPSPGPSRTVASSSNTGASAKRSHQSAAGNVWRTLCCTSAPPLASKQVLSSSRPPSTETVYQRLVTVLMATGEYCEHREGYQRSKGAVQYSPTGQVALKYLFAALRGLAAADAGSPYPVMILRDAECLPRSAMMAQRGAEFLRALVQRTHPKLTTVLLSDDPLLALRIASPLRKSPNESAPKPPFTVVDIPEWPTAICRRLLDATGCCADSSVIEAILDCVGGHPERLRRFTEGLARVDAQFRQDLTADNQWLLKELRIARAEIVPLRADATAQEMVDYERLRRQQLFVRDAMGQLFARDMLHFQWKLNQFLSLTLLQRFRQASQTQVAFFVAVLETIRLLLTRDYWPLGQHRFEQISHPVVIGLLDARLFTYKRDPPRLVPYDRLYRHFLHSFIHDKIDQLSLVNRIKYNTTRSANAQTIQTQLERMTI